MDVGIVGCGAVVELYHLPALLGLSGVRVAWLADPAPGRAAHLARAWGVPQSFVDAGAAPPVDVVVIASPPTTHAALTQAFLRRGSHVLCEKPMAVTAAEAQDMVAAARGTSRRLVIGMVRRFFPAVRAGRRVIRSGALGEIRRITAEESVERWTQNAGPSYGADVSMAGKGVMLETGSHLVDQIVFLLGAEELRVSSFRDNSLGGPESDCDARGAVLMGGAEVPLEIQLSRTGSFRQRIHVSGELGEMTVPVGLAGDVRLRLVPMDARDAAELPLLSVAAETPEPGEPGEPGEAASALLDRAPQNVYEAFAAQHADLLASIRHGRAPVADGQSVVASIRFIEACYARRQPLEEPWVWHRWAPISPTGGAPDAAVVPAGIQVSRQKGPPA